MKINWKLLLAPKWSLLRKQTINQRLVTLFVLLVGGFMLVGAIYWAMVVLGNRSNAINTQVSEFGFYVDRIHIGVLQARREERDFFTRPNDELLRRHSKMLMRVYTNIDRAQALAPDDEARELISEIRTAVKIYQGTFRGAVEAQRRAGYDEKSGLLGVLRSSLFEMEETIKKYRKLELTASLLQVHRYEEELLQRNDPKQIELMRVEQQRFAELLSRSDIPMEVKFSIAEKNKFYHSAFLAMTDSLREVSEERVAFGEVVQQVEPISAALEAKKNKLLSDNRERHDSTTQVITWSFTGVLIAIMLVILWLVYLTWRSISDPLQVLTRTVAAITAGDKGARTKLTTGGEMQQLGDAFDRMAGGLQLMTTALSRINRALRTLGECNRAVARTNNELSLMEEICRIIVRVGGYRGAWIGYAEHDEEKTIYPVAEAWLDGDLNSSSKLAAETTWADVENGHGLAGTAIRTVKPFFVQNFLTDPTLAPWRDEALRYGYASGAAFPMAINGIAIGVLVVYSEESDAFSQEEFELLTENVQDITLGITALRAREEHNRTLEHMAYYDALTGLPNRAQFERLVHRALLEIDKNEQLLALMIIDLHRMWEINDALGYHQGDEVLKKISDRLKKVVTGDAAVARMRGDEFAVLLRTDSREDAAKVAQQILKALNEPFTISNIKLDISVVIGISLSPNHGTEPIPLLRHADVAMHQAKKTGSGYGFYMAENDIDNTQRLAMVAELRHAIENNELVLYYQPKIDMLTQCVCGAEALVRWIHPTRGVIPPDAFIPLAEQTWLIKSLTEWVLEAALRQTVIWHKAGWNFPVAVNLSPNNLLDVSLVEKIEKMIHDTGAQARWLEVEITEGAVMEDPEKALANLNRLSAMGINIFIDDFGTGYSSLAYLKKLPVDAMKIDKSFVLDMLSQSGSGAIVRSTIGLAHDLELKVVAEGVETEAMWDKLAALGCDVAQGYYIAKPLPAEHFIAHISKMSNHVNGA